MEKEWIKSSKYRRMTTQQLIEIENKLSQEADMLCEERREISREISAYRYKCSYLRNLISQRGQSPYNGEYYIKSEFRKKHGKPFSEFTEEEKHQYQAEYWEKNRDELLAKRRMQYKEKKKNE